MKRFCFAAVLAVAGLTGSAQAQQWIFMPSYYSHHPVKPVRIQRQYSQGPVFTQPQGVAVTSGFRYVRSQINIGGGTFDQINIWDGWVQGSAKY